MRDERKEDDYQPEMPPLDWGAHLIDLLFEIGPTMAGGAGPSAITNQEIVCWQQLSRVRLLSWEAGFLRRLSREYVGELHRAEKADAKAPWEPEDYVPDFSGVAMDMRAQMRADAQI